MTLKYRKEKKGVEKQMYVKASQKHSFDKSMVEMQFWEIPIAKQTRN